MMVSLKIGCTEPQNLIQPWIGCSTRGELRSWRSAASDRCWLRGLVVSCRSGVAATTLSSVWASGHASHHYMCCRTVFL
mgnify:CR=1 FL=1